MLTRLEVRGFKNLLDLDVEFGAFTCIAGANGVGKSNVFDVIEFMSHLASEPFAEAAQRVRGAADGRGGDPRDLFWDGYDGREHIMDLVAEMLVPATVEDDLGGVAPAATTFLRYRLQLGYERPVAPARTGRLSLLFEELTHITRGQAWEHVRFPHSVRAFRNAVITGERRGGAFLSTERRDNGTVINLHGDGGSRGRPQPRSAARTGRTVLSTVTTVDYPTIFAARREMQSWRRVALEPSALRAPDELNVRPVMDQDGRHVAATLYRIAHTQSPAGGGVDPAAVYARVASRLSDLSGVRVDGLEVELDQVREVFTLFLVERGLRLPARALSEGTLRFLALCVLLEDSDLIGVLCMEEPENGIHPANLEAIVDLVRDLAVDPSMTPDTDNPFRQVIVNTHSPGVVQLCDKADLLLAETTTTALPDGRSAPALTLAPYQGTWRDRGDVELFTEADVVPYLTPPAGAQLRLPLVLSG